MPIWCAAAWHLQDRDTKGFSQDHTDYYLPSGRPKKLWLKPLAKNACTNGGQDVVEGRARERRTGRYGG